METDIIIISQRDDLEALSKRYEESINLILNPKSQGIVPPPPNVTNKIQRESKIIFEVIEFLSEHGSIEALYNNIFDGINAAKSIANTLHVPDDINRINNAILKLFKESINELNIIINIHNFKKKLNTKSHKEIISRVDNVLNKLTQYSIDTKKNTIESNNALQQIKTLHEQSNEKISNYQHDIDTQQRKLFTEINSININSIEDIERKIFTIEQEAIKRQTKQFSERLNILKESQDGALEKFNGEVDDQIDNISNRINKEISEFETKKTEITQILGEIGAAYQAGANTRQATTEKWSAEILRVLGVIWMIATIFITMKLFNDYIGFYDIPAGKVILNLGELGIEWFAIRFMTILMLTSPGIYLLKESAAHRTKENLYRQRGTQLSSIGAYLDELQPEERAAIKKELSKNFFSFHDGKTDTQNVPDFVRDMKEAVSIAKSINSPTPRKKSTMFSKGIK